MTLGDVDLRELTGESVLDQGNRPTCVAFAVSAAHEALRTRLGDDRTHLAPESIWAHAVAAGSASASGMPLASAVPALAEDGQPTLEQWPHNDSLGAGTETPPSFAGPAPWTTASLVMSAPCGDGVEAELELWLAQGRVVAVVLEVTPEFYRPDSSGRISEPRRGFGSGGLHAVACVGATTDPVHGRMLLVKNSWSEIWGDRGYGYVPLCYLRLSMAAPRPI